MKKMLDELKKLDVDYEVPQDFRKKVMAQIKSESTSEKSKSNKIIHLKKYVIACASVAAMLIVVVNVRTLSDKQFNAEIAENAMSSVDSIVPGNISSIDSANSLNGNLAFDNIFDSFEKDNIVSESTNRVDSSATQKVMFTEKDVKKELKRIDVSYEVIEKDIFIKNTDLLKVKNTMDKELLENVEFLENDDKIQIKLK